jgi:adenine deaminase
LKGGTVLNVYTGELSELNVAVKGERIFYVGASTEMEDEGTTLLEVSGKILVPGYVEPHSHPWVLYNPVSFGQEAVKYGTTTFVFDNLFFYLIMGPERFSALIERLWDMPVKYFWSCRAVPQSPMEGEDDLYSMENIKGILENPHVLSLGEITRWQDVLKGDPKLIALMGMAKTLGKRVDGHTAGAKYDRLNVLSCAGVDSCHESINGQQLLDRLRLGLYVMLRQSSLRPDLKGLLDTIRKRHVLLDRVMLTTDGSSPAFHREFGMNDHLIGMALEAGVDPIWAYRMATLNPAAYFGLDGDIGGIAPGRYADILVLKDLQHPKPKIVVSRGRIMARNGASAESFPEFDWDGIFRGKNLSTKTWRAGPELFQIPHKGNHVKFPGIDLISTVITKVEWVDLATKEGHLDLGPSNDLCYITLIDRDGKWATNGIIRNFAVGLEGLASSYNTAAEILVIGNSPETMSRAVNRVLDLGGGIVAYEGDKMVYELGLPLGGVISREPMDFLAGKEDELKAYLSKNGHPYHDPLYTLTFLPNDFLPDVRINYHGIVDIKTGERLWPRREL